MRKRIIIPVLLLFFVVCYSFAKKNWFVFSSKNDSTKEFVNEIYMRHTSGKVKNDTLYVSRVERGENDVWRINVSDRNGVVAFFSATNFDETPIVYLTSANKSGYYGYAKVNWNAVALASSVDYSNKYLVDPIHFDAQNSPVINQLITAPVLYVSSSEGKKDNLGLSEDSPALTISSVLPFRRNKKILLKSGDVFFENIDCLDANCTLSSYGKGEKPVLSGWKIIKDNNNAWQEGKMVKDKWIPEKGTNIWRIDLESDCFEGRVKSASKFLNNIALIMDRNTGKTYGRKVEFMYKSECNDSYLSEQHNQFMEQPFDFFQTSKHKSLSKEDYRYLYLYCGKNPSSYKLQFATYGSGVVMNNSNINHVRIEGFGCHGVGAGSNVKVTDCDIAYVGGSQHLSNSVWARYGNGVEFYLSEDKGKGYIAHNHISNIFDCGLTIQGNSSNRLVASDIIMENNIIDRCRQSFEFFLNDGDVKNTMDCKNCYFRNNLCLNAGDNGFGAPEKRDLHVLSYQKNHKSTMVIENNHFYGGNGLYSAMFPELMAWGNNNIYYFVGTPVLWNQGFRGNKSVQYDKMGSYRKLLGKECASILNVKMVQCTPSEYSKYLNDDKIKLGEK